MIAESINGFGDQYSADEAGSPHPETRFRMIAVGLLRWLYESTDLRPDPTGYFESPHARGEQWSATPEDLGPVVAWLTSLELVTTRAASWDRGIPSRVGLTGSGLLCAGNFNGDVRAWQASEPSGTVGPRVAERSVPTPRGRNAEATVLGSDPEVSDAPTHTVVPTPIAGLVRVARVVLLALPAVCLVEEDEQRIAEAAKKLLAAAEAEKIAPRTVRRFAEQLREGLVGSSASQTLGVVLVDGLDDELRTLSTVYGLDSVLG